MTTIQTASNFSALAAGMGLLVLICLLAIQKYLHQKKQIEDAKRPK
jgi:hypothetical protein